MYRRLLSFSLLSVLVLAGCHESTPTEVRVESPLMAKASFAEISGVYALDDIGSCSSWTVPSGIYQERDCETHYTVTGGFQAEGWLVEKASFNFATGNGTASGPIDLVVTEFLGDPVEGTLNGHVAYNCKAWYCTTHFVLQGGGDLRGVKVRTDLEGWFTFPGEFNYTATVVNPHGG